MKKKMTPQEIINQYIEAGIILSETTLSGDYKKGNPIARKLAKPSELMSNDEELAIQVLTEVLKSDNDYTRSLAASEALGLGIMIEKSISILEEVARRNDTIGFGAEMALRRWYGEFPSGNWRNKR